ncbi:MAG TPA: glutaminase A [Candidatus Acidoferrum sp.]|nr:glutaminase A [Candidatus Acidoferrum sp.]
MKTKKTGLSLRHLSAVVLVVSLLAVVGCIQVHNNKSAAQPAAGQTAAAPSATPDLQRVVEEAYNKFKDDKSGKNADYIPYLASVPSNLFAVVIVTADGKVYSAGDIDYAFSIQSCSKVFTMAQVMQESGEEAVFKKIGVEPTGMPFNSVVALGMHNNKAVNPLVNAGAMASVSLVKANGPEDRWEKILAYQSKFAGEKLKLIDEVYKSEAATNFRNRGIAWILYNNENLFCDPPEATDVYTKQCSIGVTAKQLAVMGATLANGGVNPITQERCLDSKYVPRVLAVMMMAGFYDESGAWAYNAGLPAKTGVGGGIVAVVPGKMAVVGFSPPVNEAGNSVRATEAIDYIVRELDLDLFGSLK